MRQCLEGNSNQYLPFHSTYVKPLARQSPILSNDCLLCSFSLIDLFADKIDKTSPSAKHGFSQDVTLPQLQENGK